MTKKIRPGRRKSRVSKMPAISCSNLAGSLSLMAKMKYKHDGKDSDPYSNYEEFVDSHSDSDHLSIAAERFKLHKENTLKADQGPEPVDSAMADKGKAEVENDESEDVSKDDSKGEFIDACNDEIEVECEDVADASIGVTEVDKNESKDVSNDESKDASVNVVGTSIGITEADKDEIEDTSEDKSKDASKDELKGVSKDAFKDESKNEGKDASKEGTDASICITEADKDEIENTSEDKSKDASKDEPKGVSKDASKDESKNQGKDASKEGTDASICISEVDNTDNDDGNNSEDSNDNDAVGPSTGCKTRKRCREYSDNEKEDSLLSFSLDMENWTEQGLCIKCKKGDQVLTCSANGCWVAVHTSCLYVTPNFDDNGYFYCPLCSYKRVLSELEQVKKEKSTAKEKVRIAKRLCSLFIGSSTEEDLTVHEKELNRSRTDADRTCSGSNSGSGQIGSDKAIFVGLENDEQEAVVTTGGADGNLRVGTCMESEKNVVLHTIGREVTQHIGCPRRNSMEDQHKDIPVVIAFDNPSTRRKETETEMVDKHQNSKECEQENPVEANVESSYRNSSCTEPVTIGHVEQITHKDLPVLGEFSSPLKQSEEIENEMVENHQHPRESEGQMQVETDLDLSERNRPCREAETSKNVHLVKTSSACLHKGKEIDKEMYSTRLRKGKEIEKDIVEEHGHPKDREGEMQVETDSELSEGDSTCREAEASIQIEQVAQNTLLQANKVDLVGTSSPYQRKGYETSKRTKSLAMRRAKKLPKPKRNPLSWSVEEEEMLKKGVEKFSREAKKNMPWRSILEFGSSVFHTTRTPEDLKDKWRTMTKGRRHR
ncbi:hypothetical protein MKW94_011024 [Papaver nudicaule]|uniref:Myb-like domain-containing protein n=1 Tax=Papaver nudicaule TaxID=74823 RepID=A0AA41V2I3_PAPNU|nr:hypothetical protein [Papaver nudicaule]